MIFYTHLIFCNFFVELVMSNMTVLLGRIFLQSIGTWKGQCEKYNSLKQIEDSIRLLIYKHKGTSRI